MASFSEFAGNYLKGTDLQGREWLVTIERIVEEAGRRRREAEARRAF